MQQKTEIESSNSENAVSAQEETQQVSNEKQKMFAHPFSFNGRIRRLEYGLTYLLYLVYYSVWRALLPLMIDNKSIMPVMFAIGIPIFWLVFAQGAKRCHDRDNSGWYQIIPFYIFWMLFADGDDYENSYGPDPKGRDYLTEV